ncbi:MAG TPA: hypothetical protein K8U78_03035 [Aeriscardovia aeriphila]|uniref:Uncharacterized protein n=1 Tax=Aeriscardovia aeriphila TaxID=218139 RepID=A0A921FTR7_9BIFI|nr:hypothetical protein [Aeriscardovia aeriphila]
MAAIQAKITTPKVRISGLTLRDFGIKGTSNNAVGIDVQAGYERSDNLKKF